MRKKRKLSIYSEAQKDLIRKELVESRERMEKARKMNISWLTLAEIISEDTAKLVGRWQERLPEKYQAPGKVYLSVDDHFRQFANESIVKRTGKPEDLSDSQLLAIDLWLTDPSNKFSNLTRAVLHGGEPDNLREALVIANFMYENSQDQPAISVNKFHSKYSGETLRSLDSGSSRQYSEKLVMTIEGHVEHESLLSIKVTGSRSLVKTRDLSDTLEKFGLSYEIERSGWVVIAPEDNLFWLLKDVKLNRNNIFTPICINDEALKQSGSIDCIVLIENQETFSFKSAFLKNNLSMVLASWVEQNADNLLVFKADAKTC